MKLSIVSTLYKSGLSLPKFHQRAGAAARQLVGDDYEIILVNDGSPDDSLKLAVELSLSDSHTVVVDLSRNFGHHKAMMTGLMYSQGERVFLIDSDLEEDPEWLISFSSALEKHNCDVVYGVQGERKGGYFERASGKLFYRIFRLLTNLDLQDNIVVARLMVRQYVDALILHRESELFMAGLWVITGFNQQSLLIKKHETSKTTYTLKKKLALFVNAVTSFSSAPLVGIFVVGCIIFFISCVFTLFLLVNWIYFASPPSGYTSLMASIWLLGGMITSFVGVVGIYLSKVYVETKNRPYTIVRRVYKAGI